MNLNYIKAAIASKYGSLNKFLKTEEISSNDFYLAFNQEKIEALRQKVIDLVPDVAQFMGDDYAE